MRTRTASRTASRTGSLFSPMCSLAVLGLLAVAGGCERRTLAPPTRSSQRAVESSEPLVVEAPAEAPEGMAWVPGGRFDMGSPDGGPDEFPRHAVELDGFWIDIHEVTNAEFEEFVTASRFVTSAEKLPDLSSVRSGSQRFPAKILPQNNKPGSICLIKNLKRGDLDPNKGAYGWWEYVPGANWRHPEGPDSGISERMDHPVVHVSWHDVQAYCRWAGKRLPSEAQWEYAARGGRRGVDFPWGSKRNPDGKWLHNIWQGEFPLTNTEADGFEASAPVGSFAPNDYGLFDMSGNVWEWCQDHYTDDYYHKSPRRNPPGPTASHDPEEPDILKRIQRGGSFLCAESYCTGYRVSARMKGEEGSGLYHTGFRCAIAHDGLPAYRQAPANR